MAINLLAIISIVFVIFAGAIVAIFVLHFKDKPKPETSAITALQNKLSSLQGTVTDLQAGKGQSWGNWTINHVEATKTKASEFQICYKGKVQLNLGKQLPEDADTEASKLWVQGVATDTISSNRFQSPDNTVHTTGKVIVGVDTPHKNKWNDFPCGGRF
jgi:hypothetical protein